MTIAASPCGAASSLNEALFGARATESVSTATTDLIGAMLDSGTGISDLVGRRADARSYSRLLDTQR